MSIFKIEFIKQGRIHEELLNAACLSEAESKANKMSYYGNVSDVVECLPDVEEQPLGSITATDLQEFPVHMQNAIKQQFLCA